MRSNLSNLKMHFRVIDLYCREFPLIEKAFDQVIRPVYGPQKDALEKIGKGYDRLCEGLFIDKKLTGLIVYKKKLVDKGLEVKTLTLLDPTADSGHGFGSILLQRAEQIARQRKAESIILTVSSTKPEALTFFQKKGFAIARSKKKSDGIFEHELIYQLPQATLTTTTTTTTTTTSTTSSSDRGKKRSYDEVTSPSTQEQPSITESKRPRQVTTSSTLQQTGNARFFPNTLTGKPRGSTLQNHSCTLKLQYIQDIIHGRKTYEGRVNTSMFQKYQIGDRVTWFAGNTKVITEITDRREYPSFGAMLEDIGYKNMVPEASSPFNATRLYSSIPGYPEKAERFGVVAFGIKVVHEPRLGVKPYQNRETTFTFGR